MPKLDRNLFRTKALNVSETDNLNQLIKITTIPSWIALSIMCLIILGAFIWGIFGRIPEYVRGEGILLTQGGSLFTAHGPESGGYLASILVHTGERVKKEQVVAYLQNSELGEKVRLQKQYVLTLSNAFTKLSSDADKEIKVHYDLMIKQNTNLEREIQTTQIKLKDIEGTYKIAQEYYKKKLLTRMEAWNITKDYYATKSEIEQHQRQIITNVVEYNNFVDQWNDRLREQEKKLKEEQHILQNLISQFSVSGEVLSPVDGVVIDINTNIGSNVDPSKTVVTVASLTPGMEAIIYVPPEQGKRIKVNMKALISPSNVKREEYGSIIGTVIAVSEYPTSEKSMLAILQNQELVKKFSQNGSPMSVRVQLQVDPTTKSHFRWTSSEGPDQTLSPGTIASGLIVVREMPPLSLLFPAIKKIVLGY